MDGTTISISARTLKGMKSWIVTNRKAEAEEYGFNSAKFLIGKDARGQMIMAVETTTDDRQIAQKYNIRPIACGGTLAYMPSGKLQFWGDSINYGGISPETLRRFLKFFSQQLAGMFPGAEILYETKATPDGEEKAVKLLQELEAQLTTV